MKKSRIIRMLTVLAALTAALLWFFVIPPPEGVEDSPLYSRFGMPLIISDAFVALGGAVLCLLALRNFRQELRPAYRLIAVAQVIVAIVAFFYAYVEYFNLWYSGWYTAGTFANYFFGSILMYLGIRKMYKTLNLSSKATSLLLVGGVAVGLWLFRWFLPHNDVWGYLGLNELGYDLFEIVPTLPVACYGAALYLIIRMRLKLGAEYNKAFTALSVGMSLLFLSSINVAILESTGYDNAYALSRLYFVPMFIGDLGILYAAFHLSVIGKPYERSLWQRLFQHRKPATSFEIITYVAGLHSEPQKIDHFLDPMRVITSKIDPYNPGNLDDKQLLTLRNVYLNIEQGLLHDTFREFTPETLRKDIESRFLIETEDKTFWHLLTPAKTA